VSISISSTSTAMLSTSTVALPFSASRPSFLRDVPPRGPKPRPSDRLRCSSKTSARTAPSRTWPALSTQQRRQQRQVRDCAGDERRGGQDSKRGGGNEVADRQYA